MIKLTTKSLFIISLALVLATVGTIFWLGQQGSAGFVFADDDENLEVTVEEGQPFVDNKLFDQHNMLPGQQLIGRWFKVKNVSDHTDYNLYFVARRTGGSDLSGVNFAGVLNMKIEKEGGPIICHRPLRELFDDNDDDGDIDEDDGISLKTKLSPGEEQKFYISAEFMDVGNEYQAQEVIWDAVLGFVGGTKDDGDVMSAVTGGDIGSVLGAMLPATGAGVLALFSILIGLGCLTTGIILRKRLSYSPSDPSKGGAERDFWARHGAVDYSKRAKTPPVRAGMER